MGPTAAALFVDSRYTEQASEEAHGADPVPVDESLAEALARRLEEAGWIRIGLDPHTSTRDLERRLQEAVPAAEWPSWEDLGRLRVHKDAGEIAAIREALQVAERVLQEVAGELLPGWTERRLAAELEHRCRLAGAERIAFDTIVASGPRAALPHGVAGERRLRAGEPIVVDMGCRVEGYCCDISRMLWVGEAMEERWERVHAAVVAAQRAAMAAVRPGGAAREVDAAARRSIDEAGFGDVCYGHGLGHGIGLEVHEAPSVSRRSDDTLEAGMVFTVEPAIYLAGRGGVRVEDIVAVTEAGHDRLTGLPPDPMLCRYRP